MIDADKNVADGAWEYNGCSENKSSLEHPEFNNEQFNVPNMIVVLIFGNSGALRAIALNIVWLDSAEIWWHEIYGNNNTNNIITYVW